MAKYQITSPEGSRTVTGAPVGHFLAVRAVAEKRAAWVVDHRPTGLRLAAAHTRASARRIARLVSDAVGTGLASTVGSEVVAAIVRSDAWADYIAHRDGITRADALTSPSYLDGVKAHRPAPVLTTIQVDPAAITGGLGDPRPAPVLTTIQAAG